MKIAILLIITSFFYINAASSQPKEWKGTNYVPCKDKNEEATRDAAGKITGKDSGCKSESTSNKQSDGKTCSDLIKEFDEKTKPIAFILEAKYDLEVLIPDKLYHCSPLKYKDKILKIINYHK